MSFTLITSFTVYDRRKFGESMASAALTRLESILAARKLDGTLARPESMRAGEYSPSGMASLDAALAGGWRRGELSDLVGGPSSGRTAVMASTCAAASKRGELVAIVDGFDRLDPVSFRSAGVDLSRVLWVRGPAITLPGRPAIMATAVMNAVRSFDLILRAGGFGVIVLDLAGVPARAFRDLAPATWLRLAHVIAGQPAVGLLVADCPLGRSARGVTVRVSSTRRWTGTSLQSRRLDGLDIRVDVERARRMTDRGQTPMSQRAAG